MKNLIYFTTAAILSLTACTQKETLSSNEGPGIFFRTSLDRSLSRADNEISQLSDLSEFHVTAIGNNSNYFEEMPVTTTDSGNTWSTSSTYYWPSYDLSFFAYTPHTNSTISITPSSKKLLGFTPSNNVSAHQDLLIAYNAGNKQNNETNGVSLNFKHALAQINIQAKCLNEKIKVEVLGIKMVNMATSGDFTLPEEETNASYNLSQDKWDNLNGSNDHSKSYYIEGSSPVVLTKTPQSIMFSSNNMMLIPQQLTAWDGSSNTNGAYISVLCRISSLNGSTETLLYPQPSQSDNQEGQYAFAAVPINTNWLPGNKYTYTLEFCGAESGGGEIDPTPTDPNGPNDKIESNPGTGGTTILNKPIKFTVSIDAWEEQQPSNVTLN